MNDLCEQYDLDFKIIEEHLAKRSVRKILVEAPDGLKPLYRCLSRILDQDKYLIYYSSSPLYGSCFIDEQDALEKGFDLIIHIGHTKYPYSSKNVVDTIYIPAFYKWVPDNALIKNLLDRLKEFKKIGLVASIQHVRSLKIVGDMLENHGFVTYIGKPLHNDLYDGQVIGCDYSAALSIEKNVDAYIVLAGGLFHPLGLALSVSKQVIALDPYSNRIWDASREARRVLAKRLYWITMLRNSGFREVGIVVGATPGQYREHLVKSVAEISFKQGVRVRYIYSKVLDRDRLVAVDNALNLDLYVVTSCPRLAIDDLGDFYKPVLTPGEYFMVFNKSIAKYVYPW